jgi:carbon monoxide dehydrogenase subunit G
MGVVIEQRVEVAAAPAAVFAFMHDPSQRGVWDASAEGSTIDRPAPAPGVRVHVHGRRLAPSWIGEYSAFEPPKRSTLRLVEGEGMPFRSFSQAISIAPRRGGSAVTIRLEYEAAGAVRLIEPFTLRNRLRRVTQRSLDALADHFS